MTFIAVLLACGPAVLATLVLRGTFLRYKRQQNGGVALWLVGGVWLITASASSIYLRYTLLPTPGSPPPWRDPETLDLGLLFFMAPVGIALTIVAMLRGISRPSAAMLLIAMLMLLTVGLLEAISV